MLARMAAISNPVVKNEMHIKYVCSRYTDISTGKIMHGNGIFWVVLNWFINRLRQMSFMFVSNASKNGLSPFGAKPFLEPKLIEIAV